jgi:hypothetical protein
MIKASKFAIAIAVAGPLAIATVGESFAAPAPSGAVTVKAAAPAAATDVQYRTYFDYGYGPYAYRPAYKYGGYMVPQLLELGIPGGASPGAAGPSWADRPSHRQVQHA